MNANSKGALSENDEHAEHKILRIRAYLETISYHSIERVTILTEKLAKRKTNDQIVQNYPDAVIMPSRGYTKVKVMKTTGIPVVRET